MTTIKPTPVVPHPGAARARPKGSYFLQLFKTTDHKQIGIMYLITSFAFFMIGGLMALLMRGELARPGLQFLSHEQYNQLFTMHGTIMLLLFATPIVFAFANYILPLQIGSPDVAFPRLNAFSYWLYLFGGLIVLSGVPDARWRGGLRLVRLHAAVAAVHSPGVGADLWIMGLAMSGLGTILGAVNMITTILCLRAPGMTMFRMPIFTWNILVTSILILLAFPILTAALLGLAADRHLGAHVFDAANGGVDPVAAPVLVLRPPRGLHRRVAVLRDHHRDHPGVQPQTAVRLQGPGVRHAGDRGAVGDRVGAPHVRHRCGAAAVLRVPDLPDRGADRDQVLQLDRHDVAGPDDVRDADAVRDRLPGDLPARRPDRACCWPRRRSTSTSPTPTSWWRTSTTCCSARSCSPPTPASTSGSRR